ncbi:MAG: hypothetical protein QOF21_2429 [Actinomycetota bacterium]|jgi:hypothetical protein
MEADDGFFAIVGPLAAASKVDHVVVGNGLPRRMALPIRMVKRPACEKLVDVGSTCDERSSQFARLVEVLDGVAA